MNEYGDASVLRYEEAPDPVCAEDEVLVRVVGSSVNPVDWQIRSGRLRQMLPRPMPSILGWDVSGVVESVGTRTTRFAVGDAVFSRPDIRRDGCYAEYVAVRESEVARKPRTLSHIEAATVPLAGITAWEAIVTVGQVKPGQRVLIHAAAGGVGSLAVQVAKVHGAYVIATASGGNRALVEALGADEFINYRTQHVRESTGNVDLVLDTMGGDTQDASWDVMAPGATLVSIVSDPAAGTAKRPGMRGVFLLIQPNASVLEQLAELIDNGRVRPIVGAEFSLQDIRVAHALSESGRSVGKIALYVGRP